jgi:hypothetical protein
MMMTGRVSSAVDPLNCLVAILDARDVRGSINPETE